MPIIRKIILLGNSKVVCIPRSWLRFYESESGQKIERVSIEVNRKLVIEPYISSDTTDFTAKEEGGQSAKPVTSSPSQGATKTHEKGSGERK